jgi:hypothetical protein
MENDMKQKVHTYAIDELIETFDEHQKEMMRDVEEHFIKYPNTNRERIKPEDFQITLAFKSMCEEIQKIKLRLSEGS